MTFSKKHKKHKNIQIGELWPPNSGDIWDSSSTKKRMMLPKSLRGIRFIRKIIEIWIAFSNTQ